MSPYQVDLLQLSSKSEKELFQIRKKVFVGKVDSNCNFVDEIVSHCLLISLIN